MRRIVVTLTLLFGAFFTSVVSSPNVSAAPARAGTPYITVSPNAVTVESGTAAVQGYQFTPNSYVYVYWQRPDGTTNSVFAFTDGTGQFNLTLGFKSAHGTGSEYVAAYDYGTATWSPFATVQVSSGPPASGAYLTATPTSVAIGGASTVTGYGFSRNDTVYVQWTRPDGTTNSVYVYTDASGSFTFQLGFLASHNCGNEMVTAYDFGTSTSTSPYTIAVTGC